ncbi:MAG: RagB/SusD family nutrient uptake outer membrane protein, partial [Chlorobi bacterium]|nr:RagB/SusD family nutrient uptake outer membrane protein [Chlorobiota bacterium]
MKKLKVLSVIAVITGLIFMDSCKERFLEITPNGSLDQSVLATYDGVDGLLIGAYSLLDGVTSSFGWQSATSGWVYGSIRALEANKGTDAGDQPDINPIQTFSETATNPYLNVKWRAVYEGISRCNSTIITANKAKDAGAISDDEYTSFVNQARALRGFYHLEAWRLWADKTTNTFVPYVDENTDQSTLVNTDDIRDKIIEDLQAGTLLPNNMGQVGRFNKTVSEVLLAKAYMQMYGDYSSALPLLTDVEANGTNPAGQKAQLDPLYGEIFDIEKRNGEESIYTVQYSVNDGSGGWNGGWGEVLNFPYKSGGSPGGCCGFFQPTQDFVNSFRTDASGLPFLDNSYDNEKVTNDEGLAPTDAFTEYTGQVDPRLDWSVGRRGIPFWDWGDMTGSDWIRDQSYAGPYVGKKQVYKKSQEGTFTEVGNWTSGWTANGYRLIRYADVLLLKAECEAMTNADDLGMGEVNAIRSRAANTAGFVKEADGTTDAANYVIGLYPASQFASTADAMKAIKFERRLELGLEGHRYYDLQRWGEVQTELSRILAYEKTMEWGDALYGNATVGPEDVNFPIPQRQIDLSNGNL